MVGCTCDSFTGSIGVGTVAPASGTYNYVAIDGGTPTAGSGILEIRAGGTARGDFYYNPAQGIQATMLFATTGTPLVLGAGGGNDHLHITTSGNVGIGASNPGSKLTVAGSGGTSIAPLNSDDSRGVRLAASGNSTSGIAELMTTSGIYALRLGVNSSDEVIRISTDRNVGIRTTQPGAPIHVGDSATVLSEGRVRLATHDSGSLTRTWDFGVSYPTWGSGNFVFRDSGMAAPALVLEAGTGNVGIGTTTPNRKLTVAGAGGAGISVLNSNDSRGVRLTASGDSVSGTAELMTTSSIYALSFGVNDTTEVVRITADRNIGIGTTGPQYPMEVHDHGSGPSRSLLSLQASDPTNPRLNVTAANVGGHAQIMFQTDASPTVGTPDLCLNASGGSVGIGTATPGAADRLTVNGNVQVAGMVGIGTSPTYPLDVRPAATGEANTLALLQASTTTARNPRLNVSVQNTLSGTPLIWLEPAGDPGVQPHVVLAPSGTNGNVGIGTSTTVPVAKLHVNGTGLFAGNVGIGIAAPDTGNALHVNGTGLFAGNVGIGTGAVDPASRLVVQSAPDDSQATNIIETLSNNQTIGIALGYDTIRMVGSATTSNLTIGAKGAGGHLLLQPSDSSGRVGIGRTPDPGTGDGLAVQNGIRSYGSIVADHSDISTFGSGNIVSSSQFIAGSTKIADSGGSYYG